MAEFHRTDRRIVFRAKLPRVYELLELVIAGGASGGYFGDEKSFDLVSGKLLASRDDLDGGRDRAAVGEGTTPTARKDRVPPRPWYSRGGGGGEGEKNAPLTMLAARSILLPREDQDRLLVVFEKAHDSNCLTPD
jgi:hypothetical protein